MKLSDIASHSLYENSLICNTHYSGCFRWQYLTTVGTAYFNGFRQHAKKKRSIKHICFESNQQGRTGCDWLDGFHCISYIRCEETLWTLDETCPGQQLNVIYVFDRLFKFKIVLWIHKSLRFFKYGYSLYDLNNFLFFLIRI